MKIFKQFLGMNTLLGALLLVGIMLTATPNADAQTDRPLVPRLTLTGSDFGYDDIIYPDGRIWAARSNNQDVEILVPVFIDNRWYTYWYDNPSYKRYIVEPIKSFKFSVFYNTKVLEAIGYEVVTPEAYEILGDPLAKNWNIEYDDELDNWYFNYLNPNIWNSIKDRPEEDQFGRKITITGISSEPLANTDEGSGIEIFKPLLYLKFRVKVADPTNPDDLFFLTQSPIYIDNREIRYNDFDFTKEAAWKAFIDYDEASPYETDYPEPNETTGLAGLLNEDNQYQLQPYRPGVIWVNVFDNLPNLGFELIAQAGQGNPQELEADADDEGLYRLTLPITVDSSSTNPPVASELVKVINNVAKTRLTNLKIESDQDWLTFRTVQFNQDDLDECDQPTRYCFINYLDNDILGSENDPEGEPTEPQGDLNIEVIANPANLNLDDMNDPEKAGIYTGYITFTSDNAEINPVRLEVTFILYRNPQEPSPADDENPGGIYLRVFNDNPAGSEETNLVFGTGHRATDNVDRLYAEGVYSAAAQQTDNRFSARFYPPNEGDAQYGLADLAPNLTARRTESRDIRNSNDVTRSIIYNVRFKAGCDGCYPVTVEWDVRRFPAGAQAFIIDGENGKNFPPVNMREATPVPNQPNLRSFTILDRSVDQFFIEYTLPNTVNFVDENGDPIIKNGWNFLSLPVNPVEKDYETVYPNAVNVPIFFSNDSWQTETELRVGIGYFMKYNQFVDESFTGTSITRVEDVDVYKGTKNNPELDQGAWNSIGALSTPISVEDIRFEQKAELPNRFYTLDYGVYGYQPGMGYYETAILEPGFGYWIKTDENGFLNLSANKHNIESAYSLDQRRNIIDNSSELVIADNKNSSTSLYLTNRQNLDLDYFEMPPVPPMGLFDARFNTNTILENADQSIVTLQGVEYPLTLSVNNANADYHIYDASTKELFGTIENGTSGSVQIAELEYDAIIIKKENALAAANNLAVYPNPVTANSNITFNITENSDVNLTLFDQLGNEVMTIVDSYLTAGEYNYVIDAANLTSGNYVAKITAGDFNKVVKVNVVK